MFSPFFIVSSRKRHYEITSGWVKIDQWQYCENGLIWPEEELLKILKKMYAFKYILTQTK